MDELIGNVFSPAQNKYKSIHIFYIDPNIVNMKNTLCISCLY